MIASWAPVSAFQTRAVPSWLAVTILVPSGLKDTSVTGLAWPDMTATGVLSDRRKTRAVPSLLADASSVVRGLKARSRTAPTWPRRSTGVFPVAIVQTRTVPSEPPVAIRCAPGPKPSDVTSASCTIS